MSDYEERKARKKREKLERKLTQSEGKRQSQLSRAGSAYFNSAKSPSSNGVVSAQQKSDNSSKLKRFSSISSRNLSPSSFRKNAATSSSSLANSNLSASSSNLASPAAERRGGGTSKQGGGTSIGGAATKKLRRLSASFDPRKGFSMGGSSRTLKMDRSATFTDDEDDSGMSDSEGGPASSEAMLAKYLPFLAPVATKVVAQAMATDARSAGADSSSLSSSSAALLSPRAGAGSLSSPRSGFASGPFGVDEDDDPTLPEGATGEETQDAILSLIESESLGPTFRSVFEQEKEQEFIRTLALFIRGKRKEIENVCNFHYQEFIHSVDELLALRTETGQLKDDIVHLNTQIQATGTSLLDKSQALLELRATHANINAAIEELSRCVFVFHQCEQANRQIKDGQFYKALKVLGEIEHQSLPQLPQYEFVKFLESKIPALKETIKKYVTDEFNDWLVSMREHAIDIGALAIEQMTAQIKEEQRIKQELQETVYKAPESGAQEDKKRRRKKDATTPRGRGAAKVSEASRPTTRQESEDDEDVGIFQRVGVTFTPVYKCIHIYENLSSLTEFENYYQYTRQLQAHLVQQGPAGPAFLASRRAYESYFYQITGFFIVEAHVWHTTQNLISPSTVKGWWETAAHRIRAALQEQVTTYCRDVVVLQQLRDFVFLFTRTISAYGYDVTLMQDFFKNMRDKYIDLATQSYREEFLTVMERETFQPLYIADEEEYQLMILDNNLDQIFPHQLRLPMKFPFCAFVPNCVSIVKHFIKTYYEFSKDLFADTDEFVKKGTELLLKVMCSTISKQMMESSNSNVSSLVQLSLSLPYMKNCCNIFEAYIASFKYLGAEASPLSRSMFDALRENAEKRMFEVIDRKIDELFDNVDINWAPQAPSKEPRDWVGELFLYLQTTLAVFDPLRQELRDEIELEAFNRMAICLRNMVYNNDAKRINRAAIQSLDNDLRYAEGYIRQWNVSSLQNSIQELRQLVNLLLADNLLEFLDERVRRSKYPDLTDIPKLVGVLHKFETETTLGRFSVALGGKASKRQTVETLIRSLSSERSGSSSPSTFLALGRGDK